MGSFKSLSTAKLGLPTATVATHYIVVPFGRDDDDNLIALEAMEAPDEDAAKRRAKLTAEILSGAIVLRCVGNTGDGLSADPQIIAAYGLVDTRLLPR